MGAQKHVGKLVASSTTSTSRDTLVPFALSAPFGAHNFDRTSCCFKVCCPCRNCMDQKESVLEPYGVGLVLYFKFLKFMTVVFLLMSIAVAPSIAFYWLGSSYSAADKSLLMTESPLNALFFTTIGSLGSGTSSCIEGTSGEMIDLKCPSGVFKSVEAHWGAPKGACNCPPAQQVNEQGSCSGVLTGLGDVVTPWGQCGGGPCRLSETTLKESCCAYDFNDPMDPTSGPDLSDVNIAANPGCFSNSAQFIAAGMCLGHQNCTFHLDANHTYTWEYNAKYDTGCSDGWEAGDGSTCVQTLASPDFKSNYTGCPAGVNEFNGQSLTVVGLCVDEELTIDLFGLEETLFGVEEITWVKEDLVTVIAYIDSGIVILFLFALNWLKKEEQQTIEESDATNCSPSDYTIHVKNLPRHKTIQELREKLTEHFETVLAENAKEEGAEGEDTGVFDVDFARNNGSEVYWKKRRGKIARRKDKLENEVYMLNEWGKYEGKKKLRLQTLHHYLQKQFERCNGKLEAIQEKIDQGKNKEYASSAFVTFNTEQAYVRARRMYVHLGFVHRMCMPSKHRMANANGCRLIVEPAPEPSEIIWEVRQSKE